MDSKQKNKLLAIETKEKNIPFVLNEKPLKELIERIAGKPYAEVFEFRQIEPISKGFDRFIIEDTDNNKILISATSGVAAACAFRWYLENRCNSYVGPLTRRLNFPSVPPKATKHEQNSICAYRYFLNYCTFGYTLAFWKWDKWQNLLDWLMLAGYNLVLNPIGHEAVWINMLKELGYNDKDINTYLSAPTFFPWQCMMNLSTWGGAAPRDWYFERVELGNKINDYLFSFGAAPMLPGYAGMVPNDFKKHFSDSNPIDQGLWCDMPRPSIILQDDKYFDKVATSFYRHQKALFGDKINYFSIDPFHEGGDSSRVDLKAYANACYSYMKTASANPVWFLQGWTNNPIRDMLKALSPANVLIGNLRSTDLSGGLENLNSTEEIILSESETTNELLKDIRSTKLTALHDNFADYPWLFCCVNNFGGQRCLRGNMNLLIKYGFEMLKNEDFTVVGIGIIPEGIEVDEILYDIFSDISMTDKPLDATEWIRHRIEVRYGKCPENTFKAWEIIRNKIYVGDTENVPLESALLTRPSLTANMVSSYSTDKFSYNPLDLQKAFKLLMSDYENIEMSDTYRLDLLDFARQTVDYIAWDYLKGIQKSYIEKDQAAFEENAQKFLSMYDYIEPLLCCDKHTMLGNWLETAKQNGKTKSEKAYFEFLARTLITVWGDRNGAIGLRDYAAKEWSGMIEDFYRPRWESYINILRKSFVTGEEPLDFNRYDAEYFFTTLSKEYPTEPFGDFSKAVYNILAIIS